MTEETHYASTTERQVPSRPKAPSTIRVPSCKSYRFVWERFKPHIEPALQSKSWKATGP